MNSTPPDFSNADSGEGLKREYWCFVSYRHSDNKVPGRQWATWLHQALETYEVPSDLVGTRNERGDTIPDQIFPVFRDEEELPADAELTSPIEAALRQSRFLVVLCSPQAARSRFVADEILTFKKLGKANRILAAIVEGEPNASDDPDKGGADRECFPQPLRFDVDQEGRLTDTRTEPIAANFRLADGSPGWTSPAPYREALKRDGLPDKQIDALIAEFTKQQHLMLLKIVAGVLGVPLGVLTKRDQAYQLEKQKQRARMLRRWLVALAVLVLATIGSAMWAWQKQRQAVAAAKLAEERQYLSGIQAAAAQLEDGNFTAARQSLITLPKAQRQLEWFFLMEWAGAPMLRVDDLEAWMQRHEHDQPKLISQIRAAAKDLNAQEALARDNLPSEIVAPDGSCRVHPYYIGARAGASVHVLINDFEVEGMETNPTKTPSVIVRLTTGSYEGITSVAFTPDSSILLVGGSPLQQHSEPPVYNLADSGPNVGGTYIIPLPTRFSPVKARSLGKSESSEEQESDTKESDTEESDTEESNTEKSDSDTDESDRADSNTVKKDTTEKRTTISIAARHGRDVTAKVVVQSDEGSGELETYRQQRPWPGVAGTTLMSGAAADLPEHNSGRDAGDWRPNIDLLPDPVRLHALKLLEWEEGKPKRALAALRSGPAGTEGLFLVSDGTALLERWDLDKLGLVSQIGDGVPAGESNFGQTSDWSAAYSADGTHLFVIRAEDPKPLVFDVATGKLIHTLPALSYAHGKVNGASPEVGFSFSGKFVYASIWDQVHPQNNIWVAERRASGYEPDPKTAEREDTDGEDRDPDRPRRFVGWSPDDAWRYYVSDESETLRVISADGAARDSIPNAVSTGTDPVFTELPAAAETSAQGRYALGGLIFARAAPTPILRLPVAWMDSEMRSAVMRNGVGNFDLITGSLVPGAEHPVQSAAMLLLKWWINMADQQPVGSRPGAVPTKTRPQPSPSATISPGATASPAATAILPAGASPSPQDSLAPSASPAVSATASARPTATPVATPSASSAASSPAPLAMIDPAMSEAEADRRLNVAYTALRKTLDEPTKQKVKADQLEWLKRRDAITDPVARSESIQLRTTQFEMSHRVMEALQAYNKNVGSKKPVPGAAFFAQRKLLTSSLQSALKGKCDLGADPFLNAQDVVSGFVWGGVRVEKGTIRVVVAHKTGSTRTSYVMRYEDGAWKIDDIDLGRTTVKKACQ